MTCTLSQLHLTFVCGALMQPCSLAELAASGDLHVLLHIPTAPHPHLPLALLCDLQMTSIQTTQHSGTLETHLLASKTTGSFSGPCDSTGASSSRSCMWRCGASGTQDGLICMRWTVDGVPSKAVGKQREPSTGSARQAGQRGEDI